jgi:hypothetical protein
MISVRWAALVLFVGLFAGILASLETGYRIGRSEEKSRLWKKFQSCLQFIDHWSDLPPSRTFVDSFSSPAGIESRLLGRAGEQASLPPLRRPAPWPRGHSPARVLQLGSPREVAFGSPVRAVPCSLARD